MQVHHGSWVGTSFLFIRGRKPTYIGFLLESKMKSLLIPYAFVFSNPIFSIEKPCPSKNRRGFCIWLQMDCTGLVANNIYAAHAAWYLIRIEFVREFRGLERNYSAYLSRYMGLNVLGISIYVVYILSRDLIKKATMIAAVSRKNCHQYFCCISGTNCLFPKRFVKYLLWSVVFVSPFLFRGCTRCWCF